MSACSSNKSYDLLLYIYIKHSEKGVVFMSTVIDSTHNETNTIFSSKGEHPDYPRMLQVSKEAVTQSVFTYALGIKKWETSSGYKRHQLLFTIVAGSDSSLQAIKSVISSGWSVSIGHGEKGESDYRFKSDQAIETEKGAYDFFTMNVGRNKKALAIVHEDLRDQNEFVLSLDGKPSEDIQNLLGGSKFGLNILDEWRETVYQVLEERGYLEQLPLYFDKDMFPNGLQLFSIQLEEEQADELISELIKTGKIQFPEQRQGTGRHLESVDSLTDYMMEYSDDMVEKLSEKVHPRHDPMYDDVAPVISQFPRELFPVQSHVTTAVAKHLKTHKSAIIQGEMSCGKSSIMTAVAETVHAYKNKSGGYFSCLMVPPSLTRKWPDEIREIVPDADVHVIEKTAQLIEFHAHWTRQGRPHPSKPTFFVISFTTMRGDARTVPATSFISKKTALQKEDEERFPYRHGYYCPDCGEPLQVKDDDIHDGLSEEDAHEMNSDASSEDNLRVMEQSEFGTSRRVNSGKKPANAFCMQCGASQWTKKTPVRYESFGDWVAHEKQICHAIDQQNPRLVTHIQENQMNPPAQKGMPRKVAAIEYIRRKMNNFFDITICDEIHELKGGMTAQGNALGALVQASKKFVGGTGTLFGGKAEDIYYILWRVFPHEMVNAGYKFSQVRRFNEEFGNIETTTYELDTDGEYSNTNSRGGTKRTEKVMPGISPFIYGKFLVHNTINVRLKDVWPDPVELVDTPTILVDMNEELRQSYQQMITTFETEIDARDDGYKLYLPMTDYGVAYADNPFTFPSATYLNEDRKRETIWSATHLNPDQLLPKEIKLQEIIRTEIAEQRKSIVYVRDTGSSVPERDVRPRLKHVLESVGAKVCILDTSTTKTNRRSDWLKQKMADEQYDVCIVSQELVKVGLDLLTTPTLIYYQFSWSLFTINQSAKRAWRIGQTEECRLFYLAYKDTHQETMATLIAKKNKATAAINGDISSDGLSAMLGDEGDLQSMLVNTIKNNGKVLKGSTEDWTAQHSDRAREILANIGKSPKTRTVEEQLKQWMTEHMTGVTLKKALENLKDICLHIKAGDYIGFAIEKGNILSIDPIEAFGMSLSFIPDGQILSFLMEPFKERKSTTAIPRMKQNTTPEDHLLDVIKVADTKKTKRISKKKAPVDGQLAFDIF